jgi:hypothetical protein
MSSISQWCRYCGVENRSDAKSCSFCGRPLSVPDKSQQVPRQSSNTVQVKKRGFWLRAYLYYNFFSLSLIIFLLTWIFIALSVKTQFQHVGSLGLSNVWWELILDIISMIALLCIVGIWKWKRWGVYGIFCAYILGMVYSFIGVYRFYSYTLVFFSFAVNVFWCVVIFFLFRPYWRSMN